jgi:hypothetical protein
MEKIIQSNFDNLYAIMYFKIKNEWLFKLCSYTCCIQCRLQQILLLLLIVTGEQVIDLFDTGQRSNVTQEQVKHQMSSTKH